MQVSFGKIQLRKIPISTANVLAVMCCTVLPCYAKTKDAVISVNIDRIIDHELFLGVEVIDVGFIVSTAYLTLVVAQKCINVMRSSKDAEYRSELQRLDLLTKEKKLK